ncbi:hypothetical protein BO78DRAFT_385574 [Aspergillus sclerotiicarbonarius CBS 121057]|uniref:N-acetyltransferase domain-containing protein n=1 Tax=Aspergillus sclerotiicarbonarius (strain CBS 121057 / IBT 28362) TaxID=1448318 RepID=A0A319EEA8_ASPSB|nr:hypothetical protein BO78DRAFT_385574 [Aspergillus sclerotiicarbonarius CBS 121057]
MLVVDKPNHNTAIANETETENENETIIAYARWQYPPTTNNSQDPQAAAQPPPPPCVPFPTLANEPLVEHYVTQTDVIRRGYVNEERDFVLQMLATRPEFQGRGAAGMLVRWGVGVVEEEAGGRGVGDGGVERERPRIFLEATPEAYPMYLKLGWRALEKIEIDLGDFGGGSGVVHTTTCMVR